MPVAGKDAVAVVLLFARRLGRRVVEVTDGDPRKNRRRLDRAGVRRVPETHRSRGSRWRIGLRDTSQRPASIVPELKSAARRYRLR